MGKKETKDTPEMDRTNGVSKTAHDRKVTYHFAGGGEYKPCTIEATSREAAEAEWEKVRETA